jgi:methanogenic corrinoid protein MtbC1
MASMNRYVEHPASNDGALAERGLPPDRISLSAFRMQVDADYARSLTTLIESEIIPRMMVAHATDAPTAAPVERGAVIGQDEIVAFAPLVMQVEADELLVHVEAMIARGVTFESVLVDLLAPTARLLGEYWDDDRCDFVDVTMGLWRLQEVVHEISGRQPDQRLSGNSARRALFSPMPGEQHSFGTVVIEDVFRREGWLTDRLCDADTADLLKRAKDDWFDIIGLTVSCDCHIAPLRTIIAALRDVSKNPHVCVMVGGRVFSADPDLAVHVGADGTARDAKAAPRVADELVRERERAAAP